MPGGLYIIRLSDTHFYGGRAKNFTRRWNSHKSALRRGIHYNRHVQNVFNKFGRFEPEVLAEIGTVPEMILAEQVWLDEHIHVPSCLNIEPSADGPFGRIVSPETRARIAAALVGKPHQGARLQHIREAGLRRRGVKQSPESCAKRSFALKGLTRSPEIREKMRTAFRNRKKRVFVPSSRKGTEFSPEMRSKMATGQQKRRERESPKDRCNLGKVWVVHPEEGVRFIKQTEIETHIARGWSRGRKLKDRCGDDEKLFESIK